MSRHTVGVPAGAVVPQLGEGTDLGDDGVLDECVDHRASTFRCLWTTLASHRTRDMCAPAWVSGGDVLDS